MSLKGVYCSRGHVPMDVHKECMLDPLHPCSLPPDVLEMMTGGPVEREQNNVVYSPSSLMGCSRQGILTTKYDWYISVEGSAWKQTRGHMVHALMEQQPAWPGTLGVIREQRMEATIATKYGEQVFKGKPDVVVLNGIEGHTLHISIIDYKSTGEIGHKAEADRKHQQQVNQYAWLASKFLSSFLMDMVVCWDDGAPLPESVHLNEGTDLTIFEQGFDEVVVDELQIFYADFNKTRRFTSAGVLAARGKRNPDRKTYQELELQPIYMMKLKSVERWIRRHIELEIEAQQLMPAPLAYDDRPFSGEAYICYTCPVRETCIEIGRQQGYDTYGQGGSKPAEEEASELSEVQSAGSVDVEDI